MFEFLSYITSGDISLLLLLGCGLCYYVRGFLADLNFLRDTIYRITNNLEVLAENAVSISDNLSSISQTANQFTSITDKNNWNNSIFKIIELYVPLITQFLTPKTQQSPVTSYTSTSDYPLKKSLHSEMFKDTGKCNCPYKNQCPLYSACPIKHSNNLLNTMNSVKGVTGATGSPAPSGATGPSAPIFNFESNHFPGLTGPTESSNTNTDSNIDDL